MILIHSFAPDQDVPMLSNFNDVLEENKKLFVHVDLNFVRIVLNPGILIKLVKRCKKELKSLENKLKLKGVRSVKQ